MKQKYEIRVNEIGAWEIWLTESLYGVENTCRLCVFANKKRRRERA